MSTIIKRFLAMGLLCCGCPWVWAEIETQTLEYQQGDTRLIGYLAKPKAIQRSVPGILVVPEWRGLNDYARRRSEQLAEMGYIALAADIYGEGKVAADTQEAAALAGFYKKDRELMRARVQAGLAALKRQTAIDTQRTAAIGYCFGGTTVLELARSGAQVAGVVSFHGGLDTPDPGDARNIAAKVLVLHGGNDPYVPTDEVMAFQEEMRQANVDWQMIIYGGAVHSFTNPAAGDDPSAGAAYHPGADKRSWEAMKQFFGELF